MNYYTPTKLSENILETPEGFLLCVGVSIARTGEMIYGAGETPLEVGKDGKVKIQRSEDEVFRPETIASFEGKPFTISHPENFVDPSNWKDLAKGVLQNVRRGEGEQKDDLIADILVTDAIAIGLVKKGLREVSCGYEAEYAQTGDGEGIQKNIIGNHLALVEEGRAGPAYAINDHKQGRGALKMPKKISDRLKSLFAKVADEATKVLDEEMEPKKEEKKVTDAEAYDELVKMCNDLAEKIAAMGKPKDETKPEAKKEDEPAKDDAEAKKEDEPAKDDAPASLEDRLTALEMALAKLLEQEKSEPQHQADAEGDAEEIDDAAEEEKEKAKFGDTAARAEILAPGIKETKDIKAKALKIAYGTKEGKAVLDSLTGGRAPAFDSAEKVNNLFIAASEILKVTRSKSLSSTKQTHDFQSNIGIREGAMTPEEMNKINEKVYGQRK